MKDVTGPSPEQLRWVGCLSSLGLALVIGCVGCVWDERHRAAPVASFEGARGEDELELAVDVGLVMRWRHGPQPPLRGART